MMMSIFLLCFLRCRDIVVFGQDKLWVIERALRREFGNRQDCTEEDERVWQAIEMHCSLSDVDSP
jgi:hypothetical protein